MTFYICLDAHRHKECNGAQITRVAQSMRKLHMHFVRRTQREYTIVP